MANRDFGNSEMGGSGGTGVACWHRRCAGNYRRAGRVLFIGYPAVWFL